MVDILLLLSLIDTLLFVYFHVFPFYQFIHILSMFALNSGKQRYSSENREEKLTIEIGGVAKCNMLTCVAQLVRARVS